MLHVQTLVGSLMSNCVILERTQTQPKTRAELGCRHSYRMVFVITAAAVLPVPMSNYVLSTPGRHDVTQRS